MWSLCVSVTMLWQSELEPKCCCVVTQNLNSNLNVSMWWRKIWIRTYLLTCNYNKSKNIHSQPAQEIVTCKNDIFYIELSKKSSVKWDLFSASYTTLTLKQLLCSNISVIVLSDRTTLCESEFLYRMCVLHICYLAEHVIGLFVRVWRVFEHFFRGLSWNNFKCIYTFL